MEYFHSLSDIFEEVCSLPHLTFLEMFFIWGFSDVSQWLDSGYAFQAGDSTQVAAHLGTDVHLPLISKKKKQKKQTDTLLLLNTSLEIQQPFMDGSCLKQSSVYSLQKLFSNFTALFTVNQSEVHIPQHPSCHLFIIIWIHEFLSLFVSGLGQQESSSQLLCPFAMSNHLLKISFQHKTREYIFMSAHIYYKLTR